MNLVGVGMKTEDQIKSEIEQLKALRGTLPVRSKFGTENHKIIDGQIAVLSEKHSIRKIGSDWYIDESSEEYEEGDNDEYHEVMRAYDWMMDLRDEAPSSQE